MGDNDTHVVVSEHRRRREVFEVGDTITPTEGELDSFGDKFRPLDDEDGEDTQSDETGVDEGAQDDEAQEDTSDEGENEGDVSEADASRASENDRSRDETGVDDAQGDGETSESEAVEFTTNDLDDADYRELQGYAKDYEDVNGTWGEERLRAELKEKVE
jgi:cobalamin biosynthesis protein CobT